MAQRQGDVTRRCRPLVVETQCQSVREAADDVRALDIGRNQIYGSFRNLMHQINCLMLDQTLTVASPQGAHEQQPGTGRSTEDWLRRHGGSSKAEV